MRLRQAGFFRELEHGDPDGPWLRDAVAESPPQECERIADYLRAGNAFAVTGVAVDDILDPERTNIAVLMTMTDGQWEWPSDLLYYFEEYNVAIPDDFVRHMRAGNWTPPLMSDDQLIALAKEVFDDG